MTERPIDPIAIDVGEVLQRSVTSLYASLVTRPTGRAVRMAIATQLEGAGTLSLSLIDFSEVVIIDFSCADEVVAKLLLTVRTAYFVVLQGLREDHHEAIDHVLTHHRLAVTAVPPGSRAPRLLGWVRADAREAFTCICERGPIGVVDLSRRLGWSEARSREALGDLALNRVIRPIGELYYPLQTA